MKINNQRRMKKVFVYFLGIQIVLAGALMSIEPAQATSFGEDCSTQLVCGNGYDCGALSTNSATRVCVPSGSKPIQQTFTCDEGFYNNPIPGHPQFSVCIPNGSTTAPSGNTAGVEGASCVSSTNCNSGLACDCTDATRMLTPCTKVCRLSLTTTGGAAPDMTDIPAPASKSANIATPFTPQITIPGFFNAGTAYQAGQVEDNAAGTGKVMASDLLARYVGAFFKYSLTIVGIIATVILMGGGILWLTSAGNESRVTQAKEMIFGSLTGIALLYGSFLILKTINPSLVQMTVIKTDIQQAMNLTCCQYEGTAEMTTEKSCKINGGARKFGYIKQGNYCVKQGCCSYTIGGAPFCMPNTNKGCYGTPQSVSYVYWGGINYTYVLTANYYDETCDTRQTCASHIMGCDGLSNGEPCSTADGKLHYGHCYGGICYDYETAGLGMPCGTANGVCYQGDSCPANLTHDFWRKAGNGVDCGDNLYCCYAK